MRKRKIDRVIVDEADFILEEDWKRAFRGSLFRNIKNWVKRLFGMKVDDYIIGVDFANGKGTACYSHINKKGVMVIDKIIKLK